MARLSEEELRKVMEKAGAPRAWSWSRVSRFRNSPYEYYLKYVRNEEEDRADCIYAAMGGAAHGILEGYYSGKTPYEGMAEAFDDAWAVNYDIAGLKFDRNSPEKDARIAAGYREDLSHFFRHHVPLEGSPAIESFASADIGGHFFQGYIDACFRDADGNYNILDWKTSSIYKGRKAEEECGQLAVYAISLNQKGVPLDKIRIGWDFLKYVSARCVLAGGGTRERVLERRSIGAGLKSCAKTWLRRYGYPDAEAYLERMEAENGIACLPEDVRSKFSIGDCIVRVPLEEALLRKWEDSISKTVSDIEAREADYTETGNDRAFWDSDESVEANSYYFATLCGYSPKLHLPYGAYLDRRGGEQEGAVFAGLGGS